MSCCALSFSLASIISNICYLDQTYQIDTLPIITYIEIKLQTVDKIPDPLFIVLTGLCLYPLLCLTGSEQSSVLIPLIYN